MREHARETNTCVQYTKSLDKLPQARRLHMTGKPKHYSANITERNAEALSESMERQGQAQMPVHLTRRPSLNNTQLSTILLFLLSKQLRNRLAESHTDTLNKAASLRTAARHARKRGLTQGQQLRRCRPNNSPSVYVSDMGASAMTTK